MSGVIPLLPHTSMAYTEKNLTFVITFIFSRYPTTTTTTTTADAGCLAVLCQAPKKDKHLDDWLTVHRSITLVDLPLDAQNSYLFTYNTFIKILYMFRALPCSSSEVYVVIVYMQPLVSSLSAGDCPVHGLRKKFFLNRCTRQSPADSDDTRGCIYTTTTQTSEDEQGNARNMQRILINVLYVNK